METINSLQPYLNMEIMVVITIETEVIEEAAMRIIEMNKTIKHLIILEMNKNKENQDMMIGMIEEVIETLGTMEETEESTEAGETTIMMIEEITEQTGQTLAHPIITIEEIGIEETEIEKEIEEVLIIVELMKLQSQKKKEIDQDLSLINDCINLYNLI